MYGGNVQNIFIHENLFACVRQFYKYVLLHKFLKTIYISVYHTMIPAHPTGSLGELSNPHSTNVYMYG